MSQLQESMEVTFKTEVESGASGFSVTGGGNEGIFVKQVLKGSSASKIFSLREGDQLLSATIFFDNIKYEDALKILQYSEPYKVQFSLKRKLAGKEELEQGQSTTQHKKEKLSQEKDQNEKLPGTTREISQKFISEEDDKEKEMVKQRVGRTKRPRKERLSWPKFQSIKSKKILGHRRSHSTSDAYEHAIRDISPTSTDTESQLQQELHTKEKKGSQKKLKFPNIGFKIHRTKPETEEKQRSQVKNIISTKKDKISKEDISIETSETLTVEYTTSSKYEIKGDDITDSTKQELKDIKEGLPKHKKKYPEVEISIEQQKEQIDTNKPTTTTPKIELTVTQTSKPEAEVHISDPKDSQSNQAREAVQRTRKKKQKSSSEQKATKIQLKQTTEDITNKDERDHPQQSPVHIKGLEIKTKKASTKIKQEKEKKAESEKDQTHMRKAKISISITKGKETENETILDKIENEMQKGKLEKQTPEKDSEVQKEKEINKVPDQEKEVSRWKIQIPSFKLPKIPKDDIQKPNQDITLPSVDVSLPKVEVDIQGPEATAQAVKVEGEMKITEKDVKAKESMFKMPKFGIPSFGWSSTKETSAAVLDVEANLKEPQVTMPSATAEGEIRVSGPEIQVPSVQLEIGTSAGQEVEKGKMKMPEVRLPNVKIPKVKTPQVQVSLPNVEADISLPKSQAEIKEGGVEVKVPDMETSIELETGKAETKGMKIHMPKVKMPSLGFSKPEIKAPKVDVDVALPKVDVTLPTCDVSLQEADLKAASLPGDVQISAPRVKTPKIDSFIQLKGAVTDAKAPLAEMALEGPEVKVSGLEGKIQMPKFEKPKFGVSLPKGKVPEGEITLPEMEADIPKPKIKGHMAAVGIETPTLGVEADLSYVDKEASGWKIQMPSLKMPKMPKADVQAPKVDVTLPSVDVSLPKAEVDIQGPEATAEAVKIEGEIKTTEKDVKAKESMFKMPKFGIPSFGWSSTKETSAGEADIEASLKEPQVTMPSATVEGEVRVSGPEIQVPSVELEIGTSAGQEVEKGKMKMPEVKLPSVKLPKVKTPHVQVSLPKVEADISLPKSQAGIKEAGVEVKVPDMETSIELETGKAETKGMKIHMPKVKMPSLGFSKPEIKAPKVDVDVTLPKVDATLPTCDLSLQEADLKAASLPGDVQISAPGVKTPKIDSSIQLKGAAIDAKAPLAEMALEGPEVKVSGLEGKIQMPKFEKPKFGVSLPKGKVPEGEITLPEMEADIPKPKIKGHMAALGIETPTLGVEADLSDVDKEASGWKIQMPSLKMPKMPKADVQAPKVDVTLPSVDVSLPKAEVDIQGPEATAEAVKIEGEIKTTEKDVKAKESMFKMPKFGIPSFGWSSTKETSAGEADIEASLKEPQVTMPSATVEGEVRVSGPEIQVPSVELEIGTSAGQEVEKRKMKMPEVKVPSVKLPKVKTPHVQVSLPKVEADISLPKSQAGIKEAGVEVKVPDMETSIEVETGKAEAKGMKIHIPKVKMPSLGFSKPEIKAPKVDVDVTLPKVDVTLPMCDVSLQEADLKAASLPGDVQISAPRVKTPKIDSSIQLKGAVTDAKAPLAEMALEGPEVKVSGLEGKIQMPKFEKPKFGVSLPKGKVPEGEIALPEMEADIPKPKIKGHMAAVGIETPTLGVEADLSDVDKEASGWKIQMPSLKMPKMPKADVQAPKVDVTLPSVDVSLPKAEVDIQGPKTAEAVKIEGEIKTTEKVVRAKESMFKMPKFGIPSFGWSSTKETSAGEADIEASLKEPQVTMPSATVKGEVRVSGPEIQVPSVELDIGTSAGQEVEKGKMKMPEVKLPSVKLPKVKTPQVQVSLPKVEADISLPKSQAGIKEAGVEVKVPDMETSIEVETGKAEAKGMKIHMPKVKMPSLSFSKPEIKAPKVDVDVALPKVDVTLPTCDVSLQEADLKAASLPGDVQISAPRVKTPKIDSSIQLKGAVTDVKAPLAEMALEGPEVKVSGLEGKIQMPKFEKPKFGVSLPKGKVPEGEITLPEMEADIPKPKIKGHMAAVGIETPTLGMEADLSDVDKEASGWKIQMPSLKMPKMPKADVQAPKVDVTLPSVDVSLPKAEVDIQGPEATAEAVKIEGEIKTTEKDVKAKESMFKMPKFGIPSFGWSSTKETSAGVADIEASLKEPQVTMPSATVEGEVRVSGPEIQVPSVELEIGTSAGQEVEKGKMKMPEVKVPSVKLPKVKTPQVQVSLPKVEADISLPKSQAGIKEAGVEVKVPDMETSIEVETGKAEAKGMKIHMPKVKMPSLSFSKPEIKAPKVDVDVALPKVDVTLPTCDVSLQEADLKAASLPGDVQISAPRVKTPKIDSSIKLKGAVTDAKAPLAEMALEGPEVKVSGLEGKIQMPKFEKPKFGVSLPKGKVPEGEITLPEMEADIPKPKIKGHMAAVGIETPTLGVEADLSDVDKEASGWKIQMPSLKMPKMPKADVQAPKVDVTLPSVDVSLPKAEVDIQGPEATAEAVKIEGEIKTTEKDVKAKESMFKMPKFGIPSFGWSSTKETSAGEADIEASLKEPQVTMPSATVEGEVRVSGPEIQVPSVELEIGTSAGQEVEKRKMKMPEVKVPSVKLPKVKTPHVQVSLPKVEADISLPKSQAGIKEAGVEVKVPDMETSIEVETGKAEAKGMKIHMPKVKMPSLGFSKPEIKAPKVDVDVALPKVDVTLPTCDVSLQEADLKAASLPGDVQISAPRVKTPKIDSSIQLKGAVTDVKAPLAEMALEGPEVKVSGLEGKIQMPKFEKPKFGVSLPKGKVPEGEITLPEMEADIPKPKIKGHMAAVGIETPTLGVEADLSDVDKEASGWKIQMPSLKMPKMPKADVQAPKVDVTLPSVDVSLPKAEVDIQGPEATAEAVKIEGEIKTTEKDVKAKESMFKMPKFGIPSSGWSSTKETSAGVADIEASLKEPQVTMPSATVEGEVRVSGPEIQVPSVELEIGTSAGQEVEKGKMKMPEVKVPSVKLPKVKTPQVQVSLPKVEADISLPKSQAGIKEAGVEVKVPDMETSIEVETGKAEAKGMKIHMPKVKMPSLSFSKPEIKAPKVDVDVALPKVDVTLPTCDVSLQEADLKAASLPGDVQISAPRVKTPKIDSSIQLKGAVTDAKAPLAEMALEGPEVKVSGLEGKIQMPKFEKPKFGVSLPKGKVPEGEITLPEMEADIPKPKIKGHMAAVGIETPTLGVEADLSDVDKEASGWKIQMPSLKMPKMPKADVQAPKVDVTLPSVDISLPKAEVDIQGPEATAEAVKIEGEIKTTEKDVKAKESMFKMPKFGIPSFGWSSTKETSAGEADIEASLKEPQVTMPSATVEGEVRVSGPEIQVPSVELEIGTSARQEVEKGKMKMPEVKLPSVKLPKVKTPQVQVSLPKVEADISLPKSQAGIKEAGVEVKVPDMETSIEVETGKAEAKGMKIHMPKVKMPSLSFSKPEIKAPKVDVDVALPKVDVTLPTCDVSLQEADLKTASLPGDVQISAPRVKTPKIDSSIQLKGAVTDVKAPLAEMALEGPEVKVSGLEGKIQMPKFEKPKFGVSLPKGKVPEGEITLPEMEADIPKPKIKGHMAAVGIETPTLGVEADLSDVDKEASGWKIQMPSLKMPKMHKADVQAPKVDVTLPSVDVSLPKAEVDMQGPEATAEAVKIEGEIKTTEKDVKAKESMFKMPKFGIPSFGWSSTKETSAGVADIEASLKEPQVTMPSATVEGEVRVSGPEIQVPSVELEIGTSAGQEVEKGKMKMPEVKVPSVKLPKVKTPQVQVSLPKVEADISLPKSQAGIKEAGVEVKVPDMETSIEVETGKAEAKGMKIHMPKVKMPSLSFSKPEIKAPKVDVDVALPKVDVTLPTCDVSLQEADLKAASLPGDVQISAPRVKTPKIDSSIQLKGAVTDVKAPLAEMALEGPEVKVSGLEGKIQMPKFEKPKFGVSLPKGKVPEGEITLPEMEADIPKPKIKGHMAAVGIETPTLGVEADLSDVDKEASGWKIQMPSLKMPKMHKADVQAPKVDVTLPSVDVSLPKAEVDMQGPEATAEAVKIEGEIKTTEKDVKAKESMFKMPKFGIPSFGWSSTKETSAGVADIEASLKEPQVTMPSATVEGEVRVSGPEIQVPSVELEIGTSAGQEVEKGKMKMPEVKVPSVKLPKVKTPQVQVSLPKVEADISLPKSQAGIKEAGVEVKVPDMETSIEVETGKAEAKGMKIHMPKVKMPSLSFSKPEIKAPKVDVDVALPKVDVTLPTCNVTLQEADLKAASLPGDVQISAPRVKTPKIDSSIQLKGAVTDVKAPLAEMALEGPEVKVSGLEGKIQMPKFEKPKFGVSLPKGKVPEGEITLPEMEADIPKPKIKGHMAAVSIETPTLGVEADLSDVDKEASGWKIQMPSLKMPKMPKADVQASKVDVTLPSVDVSLPKAEVDIQGPEATAEAVKIEGEIKTTEKDVKAKESMFKMPKFGIPSFGWSSTKETSAGVADIEASLKEPQVTMPSATVEGEVRVSGPEIQVPSVELEIGTSAGQEVEKGKMKMPEVKVPSVKLPKVKTPQVQVSLPKVEADISFPKSEAGIKEAGVEVKVPDMETSIEVETGKAEAKGMKIHMPKVKMPSLGFSKPEIKAPKVDVDVALPKVDVTLPTCNVTLQEADLKAASLPGHVQISAPRVKTPKIDSSIQLKGAVTDAKAPLAEMALEGPEVKVSGLEGKIQMPKFEKPKFGVSLPKGKVPEGEITLPEMEADIPKPKIKGHMAAVGIETPTLGVEADLSDVDKEASGWKIQMPSLKMPKMPKADVQAPKVDVTLPSVDVSLPKAEVDIQGSEATAEAVKIEGEIKTTEKDVKAKESMFKMPKFGIPSFGWSRTKVTSAGVADIEASLKEPQVTMPSATVEGEVRVSGPEIQVPSVELEIGTSAGQEVEKGKMKVPEVKLPSVKLPKVKTPQVQVNLPKVDADISLPKSQAEIKDGGVEEKVPVMETNIELETGKAEAKGLKIHMPKVKMPSIGFSKPEIKAPKVDVDVGLPKVDVMLPTCDISFQEPDLKAASLPGDMKISGPGIKSPKIDSSIQLKGAVTDAKVPSVEIALEGPEVKVSGMKGKIQMPKFEKPKFGVSLPKGKVSEGEITFPEMEADIPKSKVKGHKATTGIDTCTLEVVADLPDVDKEPSGWKIQMPSLKMPKMPEADIQAPKVDITLPSVDVSLPKAEVDIQGPEAASKAVKIEGVIKTTEKDVKAKESMFKMPKFGIPSFGWSSKKESSAGVADVEASLKEPQVTLPSATIEGVVTLSGSEIQAPCLELEIGTSARQEVEKGKLKMPELKLPSVKLPTVKTPKVQVSLPPVEADISLPKSHVETKEGGIEVEVPIMETSIEVETGKAESKGMKIHMPKVKMPSLGFSKPEIKSSSVDVDVDVNLPKVDVMLPTCDVSEPEVKIQSDTAEGDFSVSGPEIQIPNVDLEIPDRSGKDRVKGLSKIPHFKIPKLSVSKIPKSEISDSKLHSDISHPIAKSNVMAEGIPFQFAGRESSVDPPECGGDAKAKGAHLGKFGIPELGFSKVYISRPKIDQDANLLTDDVTLIKYHVAVQEHKVIPGCVVGDINIPETDIKVAVAENSTELKNPEIVTHVPSADLSVDRGEVKQETFDRKTKMPKFQKTKFGISLPTGKIPESEVCLPQMEASILKPKDIAEFSEVAIEASNLDVKCEVSDSGKDVKGLKMQMPSIKMHHIPETDRAPIVDVSLPSADVTMSTTKVDMQGWDLESKIEKTESEIKSREKDFEGKESKFKMPKFKLPTFRWSPKKEAIVTYDTEAVLEEPTLVSSFEETESELTLTVSESQCPSMEPESDIPIGKDSEKGKIKKPQFSMPKISLPKMKGHKAQVSLPKLEGDIGGPKPENEDNISVPIPEKGISGDREGMVIEMLKPAIKAPEIDVGVGSPLADVTLSSKHMNIQQADLKLRSAGAEVSLSSPDMKIPISGRSIKLKSSEIGVEESLAGIAADGAEVNLEGVEGKITMPKFQKPKFGISFSKGERPENEINLPIMEAGVPNLTVATNIADIAVEAPLLEVKSDVSDAEIEVSAQKMKIPQVSITDIKTPEMDVNLPSVSVSVTDTVVQSLEEKDMKVQGKHETKPGEIQNEEHQGWFKMPKFRMPTFGWSSSKEKRGDVDSEGSLEKPQVSAPIGEIQTEMEVPEYATSLTHVDADPAAGKEALEGKIKSAKADISLHRGERSDITLSKCEAEVSLPTEKAGLKASISECKTYADVVKGGAEGQKLKTHTPKVTMPKTELGIVEIQFQKADGSIDLKSPSSDLMEPSTRISKDKTEKQSERPEVNIRLPKLKIPAFTYDAPTVETDVSTSKVATDLKSVDADIGSSKLEVSHGIPEEKPEAVGGNIQMPSVKIATLAECDFKTPDVYVKLPSTDPPVSEAALQIQGPRAEGKKIKTQGEVKAGYVDVERHETYTSEIVKESEIPPSEIKTATFGFSLLKEKTPESHVKLDMPVKLQSYKEYKQELSESEVHQPKFSDGNVEIAIQKTDTAVFKLSGKSESEVDESHDMVSSSGSLPKLKTFTVEVQPFSKLGGTQSDKQPEEIAVLPLSKDDEIAEVPEDEEKYMEDQKEKADSKRASGRFKFWLPSIGFSSSVDDTGLDSKPDVQKSVPEETQPVDPSVSDTDASKQTEKTGWFRFPKLGFSSPSKKAKIVDKEEETAIKETKTSDEESPPEKPETFFDAEESLSPEGETTGCEENETTGTSSSVEVSGAIVTSSARTELILLERERASHQSIPEKTTK
ncbi:protein AHNAK2 [Carettochelys insculpta]|uniref:protein AHNAK2 n=1 Tax=Carettochelys insculpta TaxID=44489 RepID=UPI003EBD9D40